MIITAQLADANNNPVASAGKVVTWSKTGSGGTFATATSTTDANGVATVVFTTGASVTTYTITATDNTGLTGTSGIIVTVSRPFLDIARMNSGFLVSWPFPSTGFFLESTTDLRSNWQRAGELLRTNNGRLEVTVPINVSERFFRLRAP